MLDPAVARRIRLVGLDVDGVLTDNGIYVGNVQGTPTELKRFDIQDGLGLTLLRIVGIPVAIVSGRQSEATTLRAAELKIAHVVQDSGARKLPAFAALLDELGIGWDEAAFVGDDLADIPLLKRVGLPIAVANAVSEVKALAMYETRAAGGRGAVREAIEELLKARGCWESTVRTYLAERGDDAA